jgi:lipase chaperone LimK
MNNMKKWGAGALLASVVAGFLLLSTSSEPPVDAVSGVGQPAVVSAGAAQDARSQKSVPLAPSGPWFDTAAAGTGPAASPLSTMTPPRFPVDSQGKLVLNADTHANLEKLLLQDNPAAMQASLEQITKTMPASAAAELKALLNNFEQYSKALSHTISPENAPENEQEGIKLIDSLHQLRVSYLGAETTKAMFGAEESTTRQMIALMGAETDPNLTQQQKAERAQETISKRSQPPG